MTVQTPLGRTLPQSWLTIPLSNPAGVLDPGKKGHSLIRLKIPELITNQKKRPSVELFIWPKELCLGNHFWAQSIFWARILFESLVWLVISTHLKNIYWSNWIISPILRGENKRNFETTYQVIPKISGVELNFLEIGDVPTHPTFYRDSLGILVAAPLGWGGDPRFPSTSTWSSTWRSERWHVRPKSVRWVERSDHHPRCPGDMREEGCVKNACWPVGLVLLKNYVRTSDFASSKSIPKDSFSKISEGVDLFGGEILEP